MKKILLIASMAVTLSTGVAFGQGTVVFNNSASTLVTYVNGPNAGNPLAVGNEILLALYWGVQGSTADQLVQIGGTTGINPLAGRYSGGSRTTGAGTAPGATASFQVRAWSASMGATYEAAFASGLVGYIGTSAVFTSATGGAGSPPSAAVPLSATAPAFGVTLVPEPSVVALAVVGVGALLLRRRKN